MLRTKPNVKMQSNQNQHTYLFQKQKVQTHFKNKELKKSSIKKRKVALKTKRKSQVETRKRN